MNELQAFLKEHATLDLLPLAVQRQAVAAFGRTWAEVEEAALELELLPARYQRNRRTISVSGQLALFRSRVAVIGCGGLGGYVIEQLARLGVGTIVAVDPDRFEEHNLNRQVLATVANLGRPKVEAAVERVAEINPTVTLVPCRTAFDRTNGLDLLRHAQVVIDALDDIAVRLDLAGVCGEFGIPLVHGAIGGWYGRVATQLPGDGTLERLYEGWLEGKGVEKEYGNPSFTPALVASLEVAEACKLLLGEGKPLRGRKLAVDLLAMEFVEVNLR